MAHGRGGRRKSVLRSMRLEPLANRLASVRNSVCLARRLAMAAQGLGRCDHDWNPSAKEVKIASQWPRRASDAATLPR